MVAGSVTAIKLTYYKEMLSIKGCTDIFTALYTYVQYCVPAEGPVEPWTLKAAVLVLPSELSLWLEPAPSVWIQDMTSLHRRAPSIVYIHARTSIYQYKVFCSSMSMKWITHLHQATQRFFTWCAKRYLISTLISECKKGLNFMEKHSAVRHLQRHWEQKSAEKDLADRAAASNWCPPNLARGSAVNH